MYPIFMSYFIWYINSIPVYIVLIVYVCNYCMFFILCVHLKQVSLDNVSQSLNKQTCMNKKRWK